MMADDVVFTMMPTEGETRTPQGVLGLLNYFYHVAFDAAAPVVNYIIGDGRAMMEGHVTGGHIGEFAGIPATGKDIRVPICVSYDLENDKIPTSEDLLRNACLDAATGRGVGTRAAADSNRTAPVDRCLGLRLLSARRPRIVLHRDGDGPGGSAGRFHRASSDQTRLVKKAPAEGSASCCLIRWTPSTEKTC